MSERAGTAGPDGVSGLLVPTLLFGSYLMAAAAGGTLLLAGSRVFALSAGGSALSGLAVVAAVALGAITGGTIAGRKAGTTSAPGAILAALQAALGLAAILGVILFRAARAAYLVVWPILGGTALGAWGLRFGLALSLLTLAASCFFAMPPMLARLIVAGRQGLGIACGFTFGLSLAGLALGLFAGGVVFVAEIGTHGSLLIGVALSGLAAGGTILLRQRGLEGPGAIGANLSAGELPAGKAEDDDPLIDEEIIAGAALAAANILVGFCIWTYLQAWTRTLTFVVGGTAQAKAVVAAVFLVGLAAGAFLVAGLVERLGRLMLLLTLLLTSSSIGACASMHFLEPVVVFYLRLTPLLARPALSFLPAALTAAAVMMPSCLLLGGALPLLPLAARQRGRPMAGTLAFLAVGAFLADLTVGLFIVPAFGLRRTVSLAGAIGLLAALLFLGGIPFRRRDLRTTVAIALLGLMVVLGAFPATWDPRVVAAGPYRYGASMLKRYGTADQYLAARRGVEVLYYHEGRNASVMVERTLQKSPAGPPVENLALAVDGKIEATTGDDIRAQVLQAHIPILVHGPTHSVLLVDFLNGVTAGSILRHPVGSLTILEREPALFDAAEDFGDYNRKPLGDSRAVRIVDAPRARLLADPTAYDVIIVSSIDPWLPHGASLVTVEGCQLLRSRLRPGGLVAQRVPLASAPEPALKTALRTFASVFESVLVFQVSPEDLLVLGSADPLALDVGWLRNVLGSNASVAQDLARVIPLGANGILLEFRMGGDGLRGLVGDGPLNDDDRSPVEALASRWLSLHDNDALLRQVNGAWAGITPFLKNYGALPQEQADFLYNLAKAYLGVVADPLRARGIARDLSALGRASMARWVTGECLLQEHDLEGALGEWRAVLESEPSNLDALFSLGTYYLDNDDHVAAETYLSRAARLYPDTPVVLYTHGRNLYFLERYRDAIAELQKARMVAGDREDYPLVDYLVGVSSHRLGQEGEAAASLEAYLKWAYKQSTLTRLEVDAHLKLSEIYDKQGKRLKAHQEKQKGEDLLRRIQEYAERTAAHAGPSASKPAGPAEPPAPPRP